MNFSVVGQQIINVGGDGFKCDSPAPLTNFDGAKYMGTWYEQAHRAHQPFQLDSWSCTEAQYSDLSSDGSFVVSNTSETKSQVGRRFGVEGTGLCPDATGECYVSFFGQAYPTKPNYNVVSTDYTTYSIVYDCEEMTRYASLWYLARTPVASEAQLAKMNAIAKAALPNFDFSIMVYDDQGTQCSYAANPADLNMWL